MRTTTGGTGGGRVAGRGDAFGRPRALAWGLPLPVALLVAFLAPLGPSALAEEPPVLAPAPRGPSPPRPRRPDLPPPRVVAGEPPAAATAVRGGAPPPPHAAAPPPQRAGAAHAPALASTPAAVPAPLPAPQEGPTRPPPRPAEREEPRPQDIVLEVARPGGHLRAFQESDDRAAVVMTGNPVIQGFEHTDEKGRVVPAFWIKGNLIVAWIDLERFGALEAFQGVRARPKGDDERTATRSEASLLQEAIVGVYAEGAVEIRFGDQVFRAERLHLESRTYQALLIEPRFQGRAGGRDVGAEGLPLHVRARRARLLAKGFAVFDQAEVSTNAADDRIALRVRRLVVEEAQEEREEEERSEDKSLLGFRDLSSQRYRAEGIQLRAERLPLLAWPEAEFGWPEGESFPVRLRRVDTGSRSSLGRFLIVDVGGVLGPDRSPWLDWTLSLGGYSDRGPAAGLTLEWGDRREVLRPDGRRAYGLARAWAVWDFDGHDRVGFEADEELRWLAQLESRTRLAPRTFLDVEFNDFADRGVNLEFFERDALQHKDRESYVRLRHAEGPALATLTGKWHQRDFVTETTEEPQAALWLASVGLLEPPWRGGPAVDVTTVSRAGRLGRRFDEDLALPAVTAWRFTTDTLLHAAVDVGDVRLSAYAGPSATRYLGRTDGPDLTRTALLAGARANLQLHRTWNAWGGPFVLDGLRHVVDLDAEARGRFFDSHDPQDLPPFDLVEAQEAHAALIFRVRNRLQTRALCDGVRDLLDLEVSLLGYPQDVSPTGERSPGAVELHLRGQPRPGFFVAGEADVDLGIAGIEDAFFGVGMRPGPDWALFTGIRYLREEILAPQVDLAWRWSERYGARFHQTLDFHGRAARTRLELHRFSLDHKIVLRLGLRGDDVDFGLSFDLVGTLRPDRREGFGEEADLDPWGAFP